MTIFITCNKFIVTFAELLFAVVVVNCDIEFVVLPVIIIIEFILLNLELTSSIFVVHCCVS